MNFPKGSAIELKLLLRSWDLLCLWLWKNSASDDVYSETFLFFNRQNLQQHGKGTILYIMREFFWHYVIVFLPIYLFLILYLVLKSQTVWRLGGCLSGRVPE